MPNCKVTEFKKMRPLMNYPMYSFLNMESSETDAEMFADTMRLCPDMIAIDLQKPGCDSLAHKHNEWVTDMLRIIASCVQCVREPDDALGFIDDLATKFANNMAEKSTMSDVSTTVFSNWLDIYSEALSTSYQHIHKSFADLEIPYFEERLPYRVYKVDFQLRNVILRKMTFSEFVQHYQLNQHWE